jgi:hypothetical protein
VTWLQRYNANALGKNDKNDCLMINMKYVLWHCNVASAYFSRL